MLGPVIWPTLVAASTVAIGALILAGVGGPLRIAVTFWFVLICPGMAFVQLVRLPDLLTQWTLAIALSLTLGLLIAVALLYTGRWSPALWLGLLMVLSLCGVMLALIQLVREGDEGREDGTVVEPARWRPFDRSGW